MTGKYRIIIQNKRIRYDFEIKRNITIIRGDSATGKTVLVDMVREYYENGVESGIKLQCNKSCVVLEGRNWKMQLASIKNSIVFIDEVSGFVSSKDFASELQKTDNYYVIVTRESLSTLPYSVNEIYGIRNSGKYGSLKQTYNELYQLYGKGNFLNEVRPDTVLTEDANSGYQFFYTICKKRRLECISAKGKSNIFSYLTKHNVGKILVIADGAAFGAEMEKVIKLMEIREDIVLYLPESFEWLILKSGVIHDSELPAFLDAPYDYAESSKYLSWERYFTELIVKKTQGTYLRYSKHILNEVYVHIEIADRILENMENINLYWKDSCHGDGDILTDGRVSHDNV
ncbi:translation initiation factor 2 [Murimonas intestini]|uniref:Translation initiation factor 2 n=1 Tax=Murimonas intestini TaxID=1337051 RepID=A0AB73SZ54_9FIRM|nr:translation initiation factor 2 [Murimonas intestini]MCR1842913.1 translation initiation factor 2 [Murimonas intestini]MCR1868124.1 translation initiation factor 2 [Murimonas intestini]MCR1885384.1 translation initiation factor 2 [Murimonas intestini]